MAIKNTKKKPPSKRTSRYKPDFARLINKSLIILVAMAWAFILGVLVGKGYRPENAVPELARIMPDTQEVQPEQPVVLKAEELDYYDRLKKAKPQPRPQAKPQSQPQKAPAQKTVSHVQAQPPQNEEKPQSPQRFTYIYQTAAFRSQADALRFQQQIIRLGIPAFIESTPSGWHRVNVRFKGTPTETGNLKQRLKSLGVNKVILRSKKPL
jgi:cell division protein FtsN